MSRKALYIGVASLAVFTASGSAFAEEAVPFKGDIDPFSEDIDPFKGDIDPFEGDINPFRGDINPFYGDVSPFWGDVEPFWGEIDPFSLDIDPFSGDIDPFWGDIDPFVGDIDVFKGDIEAFNGETFSFSGDANNVGVYWRAAGSLWGEINRNWSDPAISDEALAAQLNDFVSVSKTVWDAAAFQHGQGFDIFANDLFAKYGVDLAASSTLEGFDAVNRSRFFLDWYDGLMMYSGADIVDHWMPAINWTPAITQDQGAGHDAVVGLLDVKISVNDDNIAYLIDLGGEKDAINGHGAAVASLIAARHDGEGVMGIAPNATVYAYNPFDKKGKAKDKTVKEGVVELVEAGANVINMSLGYSGAIFHKKMAKVFTDKKIEDYIDRTVFVVAAGNSGITQTSDIEWSSKKIEDMADKMANILFVGSVGPTKEISSFSNRPGESCLSYKDGCLEEHKIKYRFLVAPGELLLVSDNNGGVKRASGTSFAAPLVTGAVSLLHDRWPWLQSYADVSAQIILQSAEDLGEPGVDGTYGWGLLDVEAAMSPLDFDNLEFYRPSYWGGYSAVSASRLQSLLVMPGMLDLWESRGAALFALEDIGDTYRDFSIPLSTLIYGQSGSFNGNTERYQRHVYDRLVAWANGDGGFGEGSASTATIGSGDDDDDDDGDDWNFFMTASPVSTLASARTQEKPFHSAFLMQSKNQKLALRMGDGLGALALTAHDGFDRRGDHNPEAGGVNPYLGFASGGFYTGAAVSLFGNVIVSTGFTEATDDHTYADQFTGELSSDLPELRDYKASAFMANVSYTPAKNVRVNLGYTRLDEKTGILGAQGTDLLNLDNGAVTDAVTLGGVYHATSHITLAASASAGKSWEHDRQNQVIGIGDNGILSTAFQFDMNVNKLFKRSDSLRLSFAQPLHAEAGGLSYNSVQVIDRATGALGVVEEAWNLGDGKRHFYSEAEYAMPLLNDTAQLSIFGRVDFNDSDVQGVYDAAAGGVRFNLNF